MILIWFLFFWCYQKYYIFQVEMLYQRYFLRMNQSNTTHILVLLLALILALSSAHIVFTTIQVKRNFSTTYQAEADYVNGAIGDGNKTIIMAATQLLLPDQEFKERATQDERVALVRQQSKDDKFLTSSLQRNVETLYQLPVKYNQNTTTASEANTNLGQEIAKKQKRTKSSYNYNVIGNSGSSEEARQDFENVNNDKEIVGVRTVTGENDDVVIDENLKQLPLNVYSANAQLIPPAQSVGSTKQQLQQQHDEHQENLYQQFDLSENSKASFASRLFKRRKRKYLNRHLPKHRSR